MSELDSAYVWQGFWIDRSQDSVLGATLTVTSQTGTITVALTALLVSLATGHLWNVLVFLAHQSRAARGTEDALFRQHQVFLRTTPTAGSASIGFMKLTWLWRKKDRRTLARNIVPSLLAGAYALAAFTASVASSFMIKTTDLPVLISSPTCAFEDEPWNPNGAVSGIFYSTEYNVEEFTRDCVTTPSALLGCATYITTRINTVVTETRCPFSASLCYADDLGIQLDSGLVDVQETLGINVPTSDRVNFRKRTTCAPLNVKDRLRHVNASLVAPIIPGQIADDEELILAQFGTTDSYWPPSTNLTSEQRELTANASWFELSYTANGESGYAVQVTNSYERMTTNNIYTPTEGLQQPGSDFFAVFVANNGEKYDSPVQDPVFKATTPLSGVHEGGRYKADLPVGVIGCLAQYQFCVNTGDQKLNCTDLTALSQNETDGSAIGANEYQLAVIRLLQKSAYSYDLATIDSVYPPVLNASWIAGRAESMQLGEDQWKVEVQTWEAFVWTGIQSMITRFALGNTTGGVEVPLFPKTDGERRLCQSVKRIKPGDFANINVFGFALIIASATLFVLTDVAGARLLIYVSTFRPALAPRINDWIQEGVYQLQRQVYEARGEGSWIGTDEEIPLTLGTLSNIAHQHSHPRKPLTSQSGGSSGALQQESESGSEKGAISQPNAQDGTFDLQENPTAFQSGDSSAVLQQEAGEDDIGQTDGQTDYQIEDQIEEEVEEEIEEESSPRASTQGVASIFAEALSIPQNGESLSVSQDQIVQDASPQPGVRNVEALAAPRIAESSNTVQTATGREPSRRSRAQSATNNIERDPGMIATDERDVKLSRRSV